MKVVHAWLQDYMGNNTPSAVEIERLLTFNAFEVDGIEQAGEHEVIDVKILPDRSSDCLCHRGIARELASLTATPLAHDPFQVTLELPPTDRLQITVTDPVACRRFGLALMTGVTVGPSPSWLRERLEAIGQRSINNIVDATNYVMFALGQPLHAYDADQFVSDDAGVWHFGTRFARDGESITVLGGDQYELGPSIQLIVNQHNDTPAGIAGIKGGTYAAINEQTTTIIIEAANFDPATTRRAAQKLRLQTDASKRFENNVASAVVPYALSEIVRLIQDIAGGQCEGFVQAEPTTLQNVVVPVRRHRAEALVGTVFADEQIERILSALGFTWRALGASEWEVRAPFERTDITIEENVIEEIGRIVGYDKVVSVVPTPVSLVEYNARHYYSERICEALIELGFSEVITSSFRKKDALQLQNALASDKSYVRSDLTAHLNEALQKNAGYVDLLGARDTRIFEIGTVFGKDADGVREHVSLALGVRTKVAGYSPKDEILVDEAIAAIEVVLGVTPSFTRSQGVAELNLTELIASLPAPSAYDPVPPAPAVTYRPFSVLPSVSRDIALWVGEETTVDNVLMLLSTHVGALCVRTTLFDTFTKDGRTSYAFRLVFQSPDRTLTDEEVNDDMERVYAAAREQGWEVR